MENCEVCLQLTWSENCAISSYDAANQTTIFKITDAKRLVSMVTPLTQDDKKVLQQRKSVFKRTIN